MADMANPKYLKFARPYAQAAFEYARSKNELLQWQSFLNAAREMVNNPSVIKLLNNPEFPAEKLYALFHDVLKPLINEDREHFLLEIKANNRFFALADIAELFNDYYEALQKISEVHVITAIQVDDAFKQKLSAALAKRTHHEVTLHCDVDPAILGGAIIKIGDSVIDGSVRGKLTRLLEFSLR